ncbi:hypothetical protein A2U01_0015901, partial [Trifolium medium]|nr:hypothetical protein [Trifolium medium]
QPPQPLTLDELVMSSNIVNHVLEKMTFDSIQVDEYVNLVHRRDLRSLRSKRKPKSLKPLYNKPYTFIQNSIPNPELLKNQIYNDFRSLSSMEDDLLVFPSDVSAEVEAIKAKFGDAIESYGKMIQKKIEGKGMEVVRTIMKSVEEADTKLLTMKPHFEPEEQFVLRAFEKELAAGIQLFEEEMKAEDEKKLEKEQKRIEAEEAAKRQSDEMLEEGSDKGKGKAVMDSEPPEYVLKMQADIEAQKIRQDVMEVKVDTVVTNQKDIASKLDALVALMSKKP